MPEMLSGLCAMAGTPSLDVSQDSEPCWEPEDGLAAATQLGSEDADLDGGVDFIAAAEPPAPTSPADDPRAGGLEPLESLPVFLKGVNHFPFTRLF